MNMTSKNSDIINNDGDNINVYHVKENNEKSGWIILSFSLTLLIILLLVWLFFMILEQNNIPTCKCYGTYGLQIGVDSTAISKCGRNRNEPCIFRKNSISDCVNECDTLNNICQAFTYNSLNQTMKIVEPNNVFASTSTNLFIRQSGIVS